MMFSTNGLVISHDFDHGRLEVQLAGKPDFSELRGGFESALAYASQYYIKSWLVDLQNAAPLGSEEEAWLAGCLLPRLMMEMGEGNFLALVLAPDAYRGLLQTDGEEGLKSCNSFLIINTFCDRAMAREWLGNRSLPHAS